MIVAGIRPRSLTLRPCFFAQDRMAAAWSRSMLVLVPPPRRPDRPDELVERPIFRAAPTYLANESRSSVAFLPDRSIS